jgi:deferrochelatase/peroxidase EfeB
VTPGEPDYADVQGLVRFGHGRLTEARFALLRVNSAPAAREWLRSAPVTSAVATATPPSRALQVAFTAPGLQALGLLPSLLAGFSAEFQGGMTEDPRSRRLGDAGRNAPSEWDWGRPPDVPHVLVMFFARPGGLDAFVQEATGGAWSDGFEPLRWLPTRTLDGQEPFGFADGISQPEIDWSQESDAAARRFEYSNVAALGEFLLGYRNEYGKYTDRPLLDADGASAGLLAAEDSPDKRDFGRNGTYLVIRQLSQDVRGFWRFVRGQSGGDPAAAEKLAAAFVGRTREGDPLAPIARQTIPGVGSQPKKVQQNQFTFADDPDGLRCPFGAHIRRANPRNTDYPGPLSTLRRILADLGFGWEGLRSDLVSPVRFHRILRRGRAYGPPLSPADALEPPPPGDPERGLYFVCLNANILRQFEFIQNAWMSSTKFAGLTGVSDPLLGDRTTLPGCPVTDSFDLAQESGLRRRISKLPPFVTVRGGAYFFLPSLRAIRFLAGA